MFDAMRIGWTATGGFAANAQTDRRASCGHFSKRGWATHFLTKTLPSVSTEMSLQVLAYNLNRAMQIVDIVPLLRAITA